MNAVCAAVRVVPARDLTREQVAAWSRLQREDRRFASPFFRPEYTQAVAAVRGDIKVALLKSGWASGFFPYQETRPGVADPVGGVFSDFEAVIAPPALAGDAERLLRCCGLRVWRFGHLLEPAGVPPCYCWKTAESPYVDLARGFAGYEAGRREAGSQVVKKTLRKVRKIERELGPLRLEVATEDPAVLPTLIDWKRRQYRRQQAPDLLREPWAVALLGRVAATRLPDFSGVLSALYCGGALVAAHLGLLSGGVLHAWVPAYDPGFAAYSPGLLLWLHLIRAAERAGIRRIDLGRGGERFKRELQTGSCPVAEGCVDLRALPRVCGRCWFSAREWVRRCPPLRAAARWARSRLHDLRHGQPEWLAAGEARQLARP